MNDENDERLQLRWGVKADGMLIAAFCLKARAEDFAARGRGGSPPPLCERIEVVFLGPAVLVARHAEAEADWRAGRRPADEIPQISATVYPIFPQGVEGPET
jgi:hypothetical protein